MLPMVSGALPLLVSVRLWVALLAPSCTEPKLRLPGLARRLMPKVSEGAVPVPARATVWGEPAALSLMSRVALRLPGADGLKRTAIVRLSPGPRVGLPGPRAAVKSAVLAPAKLTAPIVSGAEPVLVRVTVCALLVVPTGCEPKLRLPALRL